MSGGEPCRILCSISTTDPEVDPCIVFNSLGDIAGDVVVGVVVGVVVFD